MDSARRRFSRATWANILGNTAKIAVEAAAGLTFGSIALLSDAAHSVADLVASLVVFVWGDARFDEADSNHPHGHARIEPLTALFVGTMIVLLGLDLLYESAQGLLYESDVRFSYLLLGALAFAMVDMYLVYRYTERMNEGIESTALRALATDCLNDIYTSVAVGAGVIGLMLGYPILDPIAGGIVSLLVVYQGVEIARENVTYLVGSAPSDDRRAAVERRLLSHPAVEGVHDLVVYYDGTLLEVEAHAEVDGDMSLRDAHDLETELIGELESIDDVGDAHVHLDPSGTGEWKDAADRDRDRDPDPDGAAPNGS